MDNSPTYGPDVPGTVDIETRHEEAPMPNVATPDARAPSDPIATQTSKVAPTAVAPARFPHAEVYTRGARLITPPHVISKSLCALLGPLATGGSRIVDHVLALLIAYIARTSGEPTVAIGYVPERLGKVVPFTVAVTW